MIISAISVFALKCYMESTCEVAIIFIKNIILDMRLFSGSNKYILRTSTVSNVFCSYRDKIKSYLQAAISFSFYCQMDMSVISNDVIDILTSERDV